MKSLLVYIKDYKKECVLGPLFKLLEAGFDLTVPLVTAAIIDYGIANNDKNYIIRFGALLVLLAAVGLTCSIIAQYFAAKAAVGFASKLRHALFSHIESLSFTEMDQLGTSTLITRMTSDINQMQSGINMTLRLFLRSPFIVFGSMIMAFTIDWKAALVFAVVIPLLAIVVFGIMGISTPLYRKVQGVLDQVLGTTRDNLTGVRVIRAFHRENEEKEEYAKRNNFLAKSQLFVGRIAALMNPLTYAMINIALIVLLWTSGGRINIGQMTQGQVIALTNYLAQMLVELIKLANTIVLINKTLACSKRIESVMQITSSLDFPKQTENCAKAEQTKGTVCFQNVSMCYKGSAEASVEKIDFEAKSGQTIGIIGGTGSGKTTLASMIPRFYDATEGKVLVDNIDVKEWNLSELRQKIGVVMQKAVLFKGTIRENIMWGNENATQKEIEEALELAQAMEFVNQKERGIDSRVEQGGKNFSGGQKQRLTIARALVRKPEILIFDDSTSALDFATDAKLRHALKQLSYHPTVFMISQRTSSIRHADKIIVLDDGEVAGIGTHQELLENCSVYQEIHNSQYQDVSQGKEVQA